MKTFYLSCIEHPNTIFLFPNDCENCGMGCDDSSCIIKVEYLDEEYNCIPTDVPMEEFISFHYKTLNHKI